MPDKPAYKELEQRIKELEQEAVKHDQVAKNLVEIKILLNNVLYHSGVDAIIATDMDMRILLYNQKAKEFFGYDDEEIIGKSVWEMHLKEKVDPERLEQAIRTVQKKGIYEYDVCGEDSEGNERRLHSIVSPLRDEKVEQVGYILNSRDVTHHEKAKEALRDSEARLEALSEASFEAIFLSEKGVCLDQNQTAERMFGYTRAEAVGRHGTEWIVPEDREQVKNNMLSGYQKPYEVTALRKDGTTFSCEIQARMTDYQGRSIRITALRDITERKQAEEELRKAHDELEMKVEERTAELVMANDMLEQEIEERKQIELALTERRKDLENKTHELGELNAALNVLLKRREQDKTDLEEKVLANVKELVFPYVEKLNNSRINDRQMVYLSIIKSNLEDIIKPFLHKLSSKYSNLTPSEIQVAGLVKDGKTTKETADLLNSSTSAIDFHRNNLRKKLGLRNTKTNLRSFLLSLT